MSQIAPRMYRTTWLPVWCRRAWWGSTDPGQNFFARGVGRRGCVGLGGRGFDDVDAAAGSGRGGAHVVVTSGRTYAVVVASQGRDVVASQGRDVVASQGRDVVASQDRGRDVRDGDRLTIWTPRWWSMGLDRDGWLLPEVAWVLVRGADDHGCGGTTDPRQPETSLSR